MPRRDRLLDLIADIRVFRPCGPSDDPDEQIAVAIAFRHLLVQFKRLAAPLLPPRDQALLNEVTVDVHNLYTVYDAHAEVNALLPDVEAALEAGDSAGFALGSASWIVDRGLLVRLESVKPRMLDASVLVRLCEEVNSCWAGGNVVGTVLLMRAVLNYVPPVFGCETFAQVVASRGKSLKDSFTHLEDGLRKIADFYTHRRMGPADYYPSTAQVEPFKPQFELLLQDVLGQVATSEARAE